MMDLVSRNVFWRARNGVRTQSRRLTEKQLRADVLVVGAGISGSMIAHTLVERGLDTVLIDRFDAGAGSTSASTALIQYEPDATLQELAEKFGMDQAQEVYRVSFEAVQRFSSLAKKLGDVDARRNYNFYFGRAERDIKMLEREARLRDQAGLPADFWDRRQIEKHFSFSRPCAIVSDFSCEVDPYRFTQSLIEKSVAAGLRFYDRVEFKEFACEKRGIRIRLNDDQEIRVRHVVFAVGYEAVRYLPRKLFELHSSFAVVTQPLPSFDGWHERAQLWEWAAPYLYLRTTQDDRALIGGLDEPFADAGHRDALIPKKSKRLSKQLSELFPRLEFTPAYSWAGTFVETQDSLPYIGSLPKFPNVYFCCGFAGNGVTFSTIAADLIPAAILGKTRDYAPLFGFARSEKANQSSETHQKSKR